MQTSHIEWASPLNYTEEEAKKLSTAGIRLDIDKDGNATSADITNSAVIRSIEDALSKGTVSINTLRDIFANELDAYEKQHSYRPPIDRKEETLEL